MPNWCTNAVLIKGEPDEVGRLLEHIENVSNPFSLTKIIVMPQQLLDQSSPVRDEETAKDNIEKYGSKDWYDWANKNWGTKWDTSSAHIVYDHSTPMLPGDRTVRIEFETAWSPPIPVYEALANLFPNTNIFAAYDESGVGFSGWVMYKGGELVQKKEYDVSLYELSQFIGADEEVFEYV